MARLRVRARAAAIAITVAALATAGPAAAGDLVVEVLGVRSPDGAVHFGLYDDPAGFPTKSGRLAGTQAPIEGGRAVAQFKDLTPGRYAVVAFHDENGNGEFDRGLFGVPLEDFGFSNGAKAILSAPTFEEAVVKVPAAGIRITIRLD